MKRRFAPALYAAHLRAQRLRHLKRSVIFIHVIDLPPDAPVGAALPEPGPKLNPGEGICMVCDAVYLRSEGHKGEWHEVKPVPDCREVRRHSAALPKPDPKPEQPPEYLTPEEAMQTPDLPWHPCKCGRYIAAYLTECHYCWAASLTPCSPPWPAPRLCDIPDCQNIATQFYLGYGYCDHHIETAWDKGECSTLMLHCLKCGKPFVKFDDREEFCDPCWQEIRREEREGERPWGQPANFDDSPPWPGGAA